MTYRLDYEEPIYRVVRRLKQEHKEIDRKLRHVSNMSSDPQMGNLKVAVSIIKATESEILRHAVEEEARLARAIVESTATKDKSEQSVKIFHEHRRIKEFFEDELPYLLEENSAKGAKRKVTEFVDLMIMHHRQEEKETFPLALEASQSKKK